MTSENEKPKKKKPEPKTREERLAAKLRENLKRRKAQTREKKAEATGDSTRG